MSFDALAPHYRWMEWLLAGRKLQRCRTAFLPETIGAQSALLLGEGNGRFLAELARANPHAAITVVDASAGMLRQIQQRLDSNAARRDKPIRFIHADALEWRPAPGAYDLIVTNFFFDCFRPEQQAAIVSRVARGAAPNAQWLVSDFRIPCRGLARWRAQWIVQSMYTFFRAATRLPARSLTPVDALLRESGFELAGRVTHEWGLLHSDRWVQIPAKERRGRRIQRERVPLRSEVLQPLPQ